MNPKSRPPKPEETAFMEEIKDLLAKHGQTMTADQMLGVASVLVGQLVALQDQRKWNPVEVMQFVGMNIEIGNAMAIQNMLGDTKGTA